MSLKREIFVNLLPQKFMAKYGIVSAYSVTFVFQKILVCLQCVLIPEDPILERLCVRGRLQRKTRVRHSELGWRRSTGNRRRVTGRTWLQLMCCTHSYD